MNSLTRFLVTICLLTLLFTQADKFSEIAFLVVLFGVTSLGILFTVLAIRDEHRDEPTPIKKVYLAGKVSGLSIAVVERKFSKAKEYFDDLGFKVVNPIAVINQENQNRFLMGDVHLSDENKEHRKQIMKLCATALIGCDYIFLLHDWQDSEGAQIEKQIADLLHIPKINA